MIKKILFVLSIGGGYQGVIDKAMKIWRRGGFRGLVLVTRSLLSWSKTDVRNLDSELNDFENAYSWLVPLLQNVRAIDPRIGLVPLGARTSSRVVAELEPTGKALRNILSQIGFEKFPSVITVPGLGVGGAEKVAINLANSLLRVSPDNKVLMLQTDFSGNKTSFPTNSGVRVVDISSHLAPLNEAEQIRLMYSLLASLGAQRIVNINSSIIWRVFDAHIELLQTFAQCGSALFCEDYDSRGNDLGYANRFFSSLVGRIDFFLSDNSTFVDRLSEQFSIPLGRTRVLVLRQPVEPHAHVESRRIPKRVAWAGRVVYQKNPDLAFDVAMGLPHHEFHFFGGPVTSFRHPVPGNVVLHGKYDSFEEVAAISPSVFMYTSRFDGIPNVLIEAGDYGVPIVSSDTGSISELLGNEGERGILVRQFESPASFIEAIKKMDASANDEMVARMLRYLDLYHSEESHDLSLRKFFFSPR